MKTRPAKAERRKFAADGYVLSGFVATKTFAGRLRVAGVLRDWIAEGTRPDDRRRVLALAARHGCVQRVDTLIARAEALQRFVDEDPR